MNRGLKWEADADKILCLKCWCFYTFTLPRRIVVGSFSHDVPDDLDGVDEVLVKFLDEDEPDEDEDIDEHDI